MKTYQKAVALLLALALIFALAGHSFGSGNNRSRVCR